LHRRSLPAARLFLIADEAHYLRNPATRRYAAFARLCWNVPILLVTATPIHNTSQELRSLLALFLGSAAYSLGDASLLEFVVRRTPPRGRYFATAVTARILSIPPRPQVVRAIANLPPPLPPLDGGQADALLRLGLLRAFASSDAALLGRVLRGLRRSQGLRESVSHGRIPTRMELRAWRLVGDSMQLAFPEIAVVRQLEKRAEPLLTTLDEHISGLRGIRDAILASPGRDACRAAALAELTKRHADRRIVAFTQFFDTARALYDQLKKTAGVALVTGTGARIASGAIEVGEVLAQFGPIPPSHPRMEIRLLIASDVLSEGLDLQGAGVLVNMDLPWTPARLDQRAGRLMRLGSRHRKLFVYTMLPRDWEEVSEVAAALARKAGIEQRLVGAQRRYWSHGLPRTSPLSQIECEERIRQLMAEWETEIGVRHVGPPATEAPTVCVVGAAGLHCRWEALAACKIGHATTLVALDSSSVSRDPRRILATVQQIDSLRRDPSSRSSERASHPALAALRAWLDESRARLLARSHPAATSAAHRHALAAVEAIPQLASRHRRPALYRAAEQCAALVRLARGIGAEWELQRWAEESGPASGEARLAALATILQERLSFDERFRDSPAPAATILAAIVLESHC
ncbi:MAG TPA: DEAD/DEAH box helicase, partial [Gemmatimonadaceae bacterium]|nr:DEAD/DEAH box helicase [Gemmatimonadaceae bacterium]